MRRAAIRNRVGLAIAVVSLLMAALVAADRRPLRAAEAAYLEGRNLTACATRELRPFAEAGREIEELPQTLDEVIAEAHADAQEVRQRARDLSGGLLPPTREAVRAVQQALDAQVALYGEMVNDPQGSDEELLRLGRANGTAERRLGTARSWLVTDEPEEWPERFRCRRPTGDQALSPSSSSK